jgi:hypothetical protein
MAAPDGSDVVLVEEVRSDVLKRWERLGPQFVGRRFREE